jgi:hypothetical protein
MKPSEHFADINAVYINLSKDVDRREKMEALYSSMFKKLSRVEPVHFEDAFEAGVRAKENLIETRKNYDDKDYFKLVNMYADISIKRFRNRKPRADALNFVWLPKHYAAQDSLSQTCKAILKSFIDSGKDRFLLMEDDATPRDFIDKEIDIPDDADILVWGGACPSAQTDANKFSKTLDYSFKKVDGRHSAWYTTAYELTRKGAIALYKEYDARPGYTVDTVWRYAFDNVNAYRLVPMGFVQGASSSIAEKGVAMPLTREEAAEYDMEVVIEAKLTKKSKRYQGLQD